MKRLLLLIFFFGLPVAAQDRVSVSYEKTVLPNGLTLILHQDRSIPQVTVNMWYHVGSGREKPGRTGFAHLFEHIMFEGSGHVPEGSADRKRIQANRRSGQRDPGLHLARKGLEYARKREHIGVARREL